MDKYHLNLYKYRAIIAIQLFLSLLLISGFNKSVKKLDSGVKKLDTFGGFSAFWKGVFAHKCSLKKQGLRDSIVEPADLAKKICL